MFRDNYDGCNDVNFHKYNHLILERNLITGRRMRKSSYIQNIFIGIALIYEGHPESMFSTARKNKHNYLERFTLQVALTYLFNFIKRNYKR